MRVYIIVNGKEQIVEVKNLEDCLKFGDKIEMLDNKIYIKKESDR